MIGASSLRLYRDSCFEAFGPSSLFTIDSVSEYCSKIPKHTGTKKKPHLDTDDGAGHATSERNGAEILRAHHWTKHHEPGPKRHSKIVDGAKSWSALISLESSTVDYPKLKPRV